MTLVGGMVDDCLVFTDILAKHARAQDIFPLEEAATKATIDIIGRVVLYVTHFCFQYQCSLIPYSDTPMNAQISENDFVSAFRNQLRWLPKENEFNPFKLFNPLRPFAYMYNKWRMHRYLTSIMSERFALRYSDCAKKEKKRSRPAIDLALDAYLEESSGEDETKLKKAFMREAMDHVKVFMFGGHDTTSSTICYVAYALAAHPECLGKFRQECDEVFGPDISQTANKIKEDPYMINRLTYSAAIIKECLRLWPAVSSVRIGEAGFSLQHKGKQYPTEGQLYLATRSQS